ncbi:hypothetical protein N7540_003856 [Penicillium herquei]|nr:hypothetical protein N7540_003856 [Penicillium herquei]
MSGAREFNWNLTSLALASYPRAIWFLLPPPTTPIIRLTMIVIDSRIESSISLWAVVRPDASQSLLSSESLDYFLVAPVPTDRRQLNAARVEKDPIILPLVSQLAARP